MEKILRNGKLVALKISAFADGTTPVTGPDEALQMLTLKQPQGYRVAPHLHTPHARETQKLQECLVVIRGRVRISFLKENGQEFARVDVGPGEACITVDGPHAIEFLEDSEVFELKNGPFIDDKRPIF